MRHFSKKLCYLLILWPWYFILLVKICVTIHYTTLKHRNYPATWPHGPRFDARLWHPATVVSLGKKLYSHCPSHPAVKPGNIVSHARAQLKSSLSWCCHPCTKNKQKKRSIIHLLEHYKCWYYGTHGGIMRHQLQFSHYLMTNYGNCHEDM